MKKFLTLVILFLSLSATSQIKVIQFNANWNAVNGVNWLDELTDCKVGQIDIATNTEAQSKYKIIVVPTIIVFNHGEEVKRYQANIMMQLETPKKEVQEAIDEILMEDF